MKIVNLTKNTILAENAVVADTLPLRTKGLLGRKFLAPKEALVLNPCNSIHTFFMQFPIDVLFVDRAMKVVGSIENLEPYRLSRIYFSAVLTIELPVGSIPYSHTLFGDVLRFEY